MLEQHSRAADFASIASIMLRAPNGRGDAFALAQQSRGVSPRVVSVLKAASEGVMLDSTLGDLRIISNGFLDSLRNFGAFDRMLPDMRRIPLATPGVRISSTALLGYTSAEGTARPVSAINFTGEQLERLKSDAIIVISDSLAENMTAGAQALLSRELRNGVVGATDLTFLAALAHDVVPLATTGGTVENILADLEDMLDAVPTDTTSRLYLVVNSMTAKHLAVKGAAMPSWQMTPQGGSIAGIPVIVSDYLPAVGSPAVTAVMLIDAAGIAADSEIVTLDTTTHATLEMTTAPTSTVGGLGSPSAPVAAEMVSLWQTNSRGLRASRYYGFRKLREDAVAVLEGGAW